MNPYSWLDKSLETIHRANWYRSVKAIARKPGAIVELSGKPVVNFASNDYLGLAGDVRLIEAAVAATEAYGTGSTGSRLTSGHKDLHRDLEKAIASLIQDVTIKLTSPNAVELPTVVHIDGKEVTTDIRTPEVTANVSEIAAQSAVRAKLVEMQQLW